MEKETHAEQVGPTIRVKYSAITKDQLQRSFFHTFDLLGLDEGLAPRGLRKRFEGLPFNPKGEMHS